jgi:hypothetical protein
MSRAGDAIRAAILAALPATVTQICTAVNRHRTSVLHHMDLLLYRKEIEADFCQYPTVYRLREGIK